MSLQAISNRHTLEFGILARQWLSHGLMGVKSRPDEQPDGTFGTLFSHQYTHTSHLLPVRFPNPFRNDHTRVCTEPYIDTFGSLDEAIEQGKLAAHTAMLVTDQQQQA